VSKSENENERKGVRHYMSDEKREKNVERVGVRGKERMKVKRRKEGRKVGR